MRILLVEDDPDITRQLKGALADAGYAVDHAPDGDTALARTLAFFRQHLAQ